MHLSFCFKEGWSSRLVARMSTGLKKLKCHPRVHLPPGADLTRVCPSWSDVLRGRAGQAVLLSLQGRDGQRPICRAAMLGEAQVHPPCTAPGDSAPPGRARANRDEALPAHSSHARHSHCTWVESRSKAGYSLPRACSKYLPRIS